ncbi:MAG: SpoIIE family protein phosphatase, partial [Pseudonocardia sp.]|nr:SpoIIE family protein phosphatase [Pseudonocardia sp.]
MSDDDELLWGRIGDAGVVGRAFEDLPVGATVLEGPEHRFVAANAAYRAMVGRQDIIGMPVREAFPELLGQQLFEAVDSIYASGEPYSMRGWRMHVTFDESGPQEIFLDVDLVPRRAADGTVHGILCTLRDATQEVRQRLAAQEQARVAERRFEQARDVIAALQRELLPHGLPVLPRVRIAGSYLLADADTAAGGDWFDAVALPDGRIGLVVGDVVGHGVAASAVMGQLRAIVAERLSAGAAIPDALGAVDAAAGRIRGARAATVCVAVLDPADGALSYCTAGHPPPLLLPAGGEPRYLPVTGAGPLGVGARFTVGADRLELGDVVLLYTDGIIERPGREVAASTVELAQVAADTVAGRAFQTAQTSPVERACTQTLEMLVRATGHADDITLLAAQRIDPQPDLELTVPAQVSAVGVIRAVIWSWLEEVGAAVDDVFTVQHVVGELVTNAVEHAYGVEPGPDAAEVTVRAQLTAAGQLQVEVTDRGRWRDGDVGPDPVPSDSLASGRGRGLAMSRELTDELHVDGRSDGTTVTVVHRLSRPARLLTAADPETGELARGL